MSSKRPGVRARRRGAIDVALTALGRAVQLSAPSQRGGRMFATAELAFERGRPDLATAMLVEIERLDLNPVEVARARWVSELLDARAHCRHAGNGPRSADEPPSPQVRQLRVVARA